MRTSSLRTRGVLAGAAVVAVAGAVALLGPGGGGTPSASGPGPTVAAERRDLATSLTAAGEVRRSSETVVAHASPVAPGSGSTLSTGSPTSSTSVMTTSTASSTTSSTTTSTTSSTVPASPTTTSTSVVATTSSPTSSTSAPRTPTPGPGPGGPAPAPGEGGGAIPSATLTGIAAVGRRADRGTVLYRADEQPVVALLGAVPAWRSLAVGVDDGVDVRQLEENLVALGHGAGLTVDDTFTAATAAAVETWETALGRAHPDGEVALGDVAYLAAAGDVLAHRAAVGDTLGAGTPVLALGTEQRQLVAQVAATVAGPGREVTDGRVELVVALGGADRGRRNGAAATVALVDTRRDGVVAVPVAALVDDGGSPAVRVADDGDDPGGDRVVPVTTGLVAGAWVEVTSGLDAGEEVRLPG